MGLELAFWLAWHGYHGSFGVAKSQDEQHLVPANVFPFDFLISSLFPRSVYSCIRSSSTLY